MEEQLTKFDIRILREIQNDSTLSSSELGERVGLSQSPCWRRLQKLRELGYIKKEVAILDKSKFEDGFNIYSFLKMSRLTDGEREESMQWYQSFIFKTLFKLPGVQDVQSTVTLMELKSTTAIPISIK